MTYIENWLHKTRYNSYTVEDKQTKLDMWTDVGWLYLVSWPLDRSSSVIEQKSVLKLMNRIVYAGLQTYIFMPTVASPPPPKFTILH